MILAELRDVAVLHVRPELLAWCKERFRNVWPVPMQQMELFK